MTHVLTADEIAGRSVEDSVVTVGVFDGVHVGHQKVLHALLMKKRGTGAKRSVLMTFDRHPLGVTHPDMVPPLLTTLEEKLSLLERFDIDVIFVERFTDELARMEYRDFIERRLVKRLGMVHLVIGYDFHLGRGRRGSQDALVKMGVEAGFGVTVVPPVVVGGSVISSTKIRRALSKRRLGGAARCLTRAYFFDADVVRGEGIGRELEFPTANVTIPSQGKLLPPEGVYAVEVETGGATHGGMMNIGRAPTLHGGSRRRIEVHLFDFSGDLYGKRLRVHCLRYLRRERAFRGPEELRVQLARDREKALAILEKND
jgi:riboflavin kinase/FMN adenylyltransferase